MSLRGHKGGSNRSEGLATPMRLAPWEIEERKQKRALDYKGRVIRKKTHRTYSDDPNRDDLRRLALCSHLRGTTDIAYLTSKAEEVTCGRCLRIMRNRQQS